MAPARGRAKKLDVRFALVRIAAAMRDKGGMDAGYTVLMLAVDEVDSLRAECACLHATLGRRKRAAKIRIVGAP